MRILFVTVCLPTRFTGSHLTLPMYGWLVVELSVSVPGQIIFLGDGAPNSPWYMEVCGFGISPSVDYSNRVQAFPLSGAAEKSMNL